MSTATPPDVAARHLPPQVQELLKAFPPNVNPETYKIEDVTQLLQAASYLPMFSVHNPAAQNEPLYSPYVPFLPVAFLVNEQTHRFQVDVNASRSGLTTFNVVGGPVGKVRIRWTVMPTAFHPSPTRRPPPRPLIPFIAQRFTMLDGEFSFEDSHGSGFRGFGAGRTFPVNVDGRRQLRIGAVVEILEGLGRLKGYKGLAVVNGWIQPPQELALNITVRLIDPTGNLQATNCLSPIEPIPSPDSSAMFMCFMGEIDPDNPVQLITGPDGQMLGSHVYELLRSVKIDMDVDSTNGIKSKCTLGPIVGRVKADLYFNAFDPNPVTPVQTTNSLFEFFNLSGVQVGTLRANMVEGRAFRTELSGAPLPVFRMAGFGPIQNGTGQFRGADGMMSMNSIVSVFPRTLSNLYVLRLQDPMR